MHSDTPSSLPAMDPEAWWWFNAIRKSIFRVRDSRRTVPVGVPGLRPRYSYAAGMNVMEAEPKLYRYAYVYDDATREARNDYIEVTENLDPHPAVRAVLEAGWNPTGKPMTTVVLEWPSLSEDGTRLAYFQSEQKIARYLRTVTSPEKYIKARWPYLPDHMVRDFVARAQTKTPVILHTGKDIVSGVQLGPNSCMKWGDDDGSEDWIADWEHHPYAAYDPAFGWRLAVRPAGSDGGSGIKYAARALVLHDSRGPWQEGESLKDAIFVRSYKHNPGAYSHSDEALESWLRHMGAVKYSNWPDGVRLAAVASIDYPSRNVFPYIDGDNHFVYDAGDHYIIDSDDGEFECRNQDGTADEAERRSCASCGRGHRDTEDGIWVGLYGDEWVGPCCSDAYVYACGRRRERYYVLEGDAVQVGSDWYVAEYLSDNGIVELADGGYARESEAFECPIDGEWYVYEDGVDTVDEGWVHRSNAWECEGSGDWYSTNTDPVIVDGDKYHPDYAPDEDADDVDPEFTKPYDKPEGSMSNELQQPLDLPVLPDPEPTLYYRNREPGSEHLVYRVVGERVEYLTTAATNDQWDRVYLRTPADIRGPDFFPVASPDEEIYMHPATTFLYRAGERWIDVLHPGATSWQLDVGEPNDWLTSPHYEYRCVSHTLQPVEAA